MSISFRKIRWVVAGAALVLVFALAAGTWFRADSAQVGGEVADAGSYAPVTILIDERRNSVHFSCDRMASFLASYENAEVSKVARELEAKVEALLIVAADCSRLPRVDCLAGRAVT